MMNEWILSSSVLIAAVLLGRFLLRGRISLRLQYALWAVVLVRLLLPVQLFTSDFGTGSVAQTVDIAEPVRQVYFSANENRYEQERIGGCQVIKTDDMGYLMFYIGYEDINTARICVARSDNGITKWERSLLNPIIEPTEGSWDSEATYKPTVAWNHEEGKWMLWYNGRTGCNEYIGHAFFDHRDLFPKEVK